MGIIDRRPRDWGYKAMFQRKDLPGLQSMIKRIQETHDVDLIDDLNLKFEQKLSKTNEPVLLDNGIEINAVTKTEDLVVNVGLEACIRMILQTSTGRWTYMHVSKGNKIPPTVTDIGIDNSGGGPFPLQLSKYGWSEARGMRLFFGCLGPQDTGAIIDTSPPLGASNIDEMAIGTGSAQFPTSTMLNREIFGDLQLSRTQTLDLVLYEHAWMFSCVIEFCPVCD